MDKTIFTSSGTASNSRSLASAECDLPVAQDQILLALMSRVQDATARLHRLHDTGHSLADNIFGPIPQSAGLVGAGNRDANGVLTMFQYAIDNLHQALDECEGDMQRLRAL